jgi:hypothetical protein
VSPSPFAKATEDKSGYAENRRGMTIVGANTIRPYVDTIELYPLPLSSRGLTAGPRS